MTVKRTELEILNFAIDIAAYKQELIYKEKRLKSENDYVKCCDACEKKPKEDIEWLKRKHLQEINKLEEEHRLDKEKAVDRAKLQKEIEQKEEQLNMLRWLYKEECE